MTEEALEVGVLVARRPQGDEGALLDFARRAAEDARGPLEEATGRRWRFHGLDPEALGSDDPRRPSDFLDVASLHMAEGPYDAVVVVTDVPLTSRRHTMEPGLASPAARVAIVSTRRLRAAPRGEDTRALDAPAVRWNAAWLVTHLLGHALGARHEAIGAMRPFRFDPDLRGAPPLGPRATAAVRRSAEALPDRAITGAGALRTAAFHAWSALRHARLVAWPLVRNRAPLLPLALPALATAAVAPLFILVFTAEIWDVGLNLPDATAAGFAASAILAATLYVTRAQGLFFPRKDRTTITEHVAVVNVTVLLTMLLAMAGLFTMLVALTLAVELWVFPPDLITTWPTLNQPRVTFLDKLRIAAFISTVGVLTGALAGGLESRAVIRHLALFLEEP